MDKLVLIIHQPHDVLTDEVKEDILQLSELDRGVRLNPVSFNAEGSFLEWLGRYINSAWPVAVLLPNTCSNEDLMKAVVIATETEANPVVLRPRDRNMLREAVLPLRHQLSTATSH